MKVMRRVAVASFLPEHLIVSQLLLSSVFISSNIKLMNMSFKNLNTLILLVYDMFNYVLLI